MSIDIMIAVCGFLSQVVSPILSQMKEGQAVGLVGWSLSVVENSNLMSTPMSALATLFRFSSGICLSLIYCLSYFILSIAKKMECKAKNRLEIQDNVWFELPPISSRRSMARFVILAK